MFCLCDSAVTCQVGERPGGKSPRKASDGNIFFCVVTCLCSSWKFLIISKASSNIPWRDGPAWRQRRWLFMQLRINSLPLRWAQEYLWFAKALSCGFLFLMPAVCMRSSASLDTQCKCHMQLQRVSISYFGGFWACLIRA